MNLLGNTAPPENAGGGGHRVFGFDVQFTVSGIISKHRWYSLNQSAATGAIFNRDTQALLSSQIFGALTNNAWNEVVTNFRVNPGVTYRFATAIDGGNIPFDSDGLSANFISGPVTVLAHSGSFRNFGTGVEFPGTGSNSGMGDELFWQDFEFIPDVTEVPTETDASEEWIEPIYDAVVSDLQRIGYFDKVNEHEPKNAPGYGLTAAVWVQQIRPTRSSGLKSTSAVVIFNVRIYSNMLQEPEDLIDRNMTRATSRVMREFHDNYDFDLDPIVRNIDVFGQEGFPLAAQAGYLNMDNKMFRVMTINVPVICNDVWPQIKD